VLSELRRLSRSIQPARHRYAVMFAEWKNITHSVAVQAAIDRIMLELQVALEEAIAADPSLRDDPDALGQAAVESHYGAYERGGFGDLTLPEQAEFLEVIRLTDSFDFGYMAGIGVMVKGFFGLANWPLPGLAPYR